VQHALFVTALIRIAEFSEPSGRLYYTIGEDEKLSIPQVRVQADQVFHITGSANSFDFLPEHRHLSGKTELNVHGQIQESGNYDVLLGEDKLAGASFNFSREESELEFLNEEQTLEIIAAAGLSQVNVLDSELSTIAKSIGELDKGKTLWRMLVLLALIFLAIEVLLIKFWK
jgi:hypothetical protein